MKNKLLIFIIVIFSGCVVLKKSVLKTSLYDFDSSLIETNNPEIIDSIAKNTLKFNNFEAKFKLKVNRSKQTFNLRGDLNILKNNSIIIEPKILFIPINSIVIKNNNAKIYYKNDTIPFNIDLDSVTRSYFLFDIDIQEFIQKSLTNSIYLIKQNKYYLTTNDEQIIIKNFNLEDQYENSLLHEIYFSKENYKMLKQKLISTKKNKSAEITYSDFKQIDEFTSFLFPNNILISFNKEFELEIEISFYKTKVN